MDRLRRQFGMDLLLSWARRAWMLLLLLLLLGALQDLRWELGWESWHAWKWRLSMRKRLRIVRRHGGLGGRHVLVRRRRGWLPWLLTHHGLNLLQAHHPPRRRRKLLLRLRLSGGRGLLGLEAPDIGTRLQLRDVVGIMVALIAGPSGLRGVRNGRPLLLGRGVASLVDHLLFLQGVCDLGRLAGKVEIASDALLGRRGVAKGVVVEGIVGLVELLA
jgi:hypothetical protein